MPDRPAPSLSLKPGRSLSITTPEELMRIAAMAQGYGVGRIKLTAAQRLAFWDIPQESVQAFSEELATLGPQLRANVQTCSGPERCRHALQASTAMGQRIENRLELQQINGKIRAGVSACPRCCGESQVRDIGLVGRPSGWRLYVGGNAGGRPRIADLLATDLDDDAALRLIERFLTLYAANARGPADRTARFMERQGLDDVRQALGIATLDVR